MFRNTDRPHSWPAAAVRDAERLVQVQVADIRADLARRSQADLRVHVRAIHVDLSAELVDDLADFTDRFLEHAMRRGIRDHQARQIIPVLRSLGAKVIDINVALVIAGHSDNFHARDDRAGGIGAVRRNRDEADVSLALTTRFVIRPNREQARVFAL